MAATSPSSAAGDLTVRPGATFDTSSQQGNAGNIELSAKNTVSLASAIVQPVPHRTDGPGPCWSIHGYRVINAGNSMW